MTVGLGDSGIVNPHWEKLQPGSNTTSPQPRDSTVGRGIHANPARPATMHELGLGDLVEATAEARRN